MLRIAVVDGQGGGIGSLIVKRLKDEFGETLEIIAPRVSVWVNTWQTK